MKFVVFSLLALGSGVIALPTASVASVNTGSMSTTHSHTKRLEILSQNIGMSIGRIIGMQLSGQGTEAPLKAPTANDGFVAGAAQKIGGNIGWQVGQIIALGHTV